MLYNDNRIHIFVANYGSGKTEVALNYALYLRTLVSKVVVIDLDVVNLYFRSRDLKELFATAGVDIISSISGYEKADSPSLSPKIIGYLQNPDYHVILDVGGDANGATVLGSLNHELSKHEYNAYLVVNVNRPFTKTKNEIIDVLNMVENKGRIKIKKFINNTNLQEFSTIENIQHGETLIDDVSKSTDISIIFNCIYEDLWGNANGLKYPLMKITRFMKKPWESKAELPLGLKYT